MIMELAKVSFVEHEHMHEMEQDLKRKLSESTRRDLGRTDSLKTTILSLVVGDQYDHAKEELIAYVGLKTDYPAFQWRAERYAEHCCELIQAIKTKRNFPGLANLALAKQQDVHEKILMHFEELKRNLNQIEKIEREQKLLDVRSTVWIMYSLVISVGFVLLGMLFNDFRSGMFNSFFRVFDVALDSATTWLVSLIGFS